jgi:hypothetical protein
VIPYDALDDLCDRMDHVDENLALMLVARTNLDRLEGLVGLKEQLAARLAAVVVQAERAAHRAERAVGALERSAR